MLRSKALPYFGLNQLVDCASHFGQSGNSYFGWESQASQPNARNEGQLFVLQIPSGNLT
jgi:hypothetical protein